MKKLPWFGSLGGRGRRAARALKVGGAAPERLEARAVPATVIVQSLDDGVGEIKANPDGTFSAPTLRAAVNFANIRPGADTIRYAPALDGGYAALTANDDVYPFAYGGPTALVVTDDLSIEGPSKGVVLNAQRERRHFAVAAFKSLTLSNLRLHDGTIQGGKGGNGAYGGGGGAGMGGSIYGISATITLTNCEFFGNTALGGDGGDSTFPNDDPGYAGGGGGGGSSAFAGGNGADQDSGGGGGGGTEGPGGDAVKNVGGGGGVNISEVPTPPNAAGSNGSGGGGGTRSAFNQNSGGNSKGQNLAGFGGGGGGGSSGFRLLGSGGGGSGDFGAGGGGSGQYGGKFGGMGGFGGGGGASDSGKPMGSFYGGGQGGYRSDTLHSGGGGGGAGMGGAIFLNSGTLTLTNCTLASNEAAGGQGGGGGEVFESIGGSPGQSLGGAIFALGGVRVVTNNCTIIGNDGDSQIKIVYRVDGSRRREATLTLRNTVVAGPGSTGPDVSVQGLRGARTPKVYGFANFLGRVGRVPRSIVVGRGDPKVGPLADNGGPTRTMLPLPGSPLINAGRKGRRGLLPTTDARGLPRVVGGRVDIGSVEVS